MKINDGSSNDIKIPSLRKARENDFKTRCVVSININNLVEKTYRKVISSNFLW